MQTARRLYLYVMSGITLAVIAFGLSTLLDVLITGSGFLSRPYGNGASRPEQLSLAIAMLGVGVPVWAVHWRVVQHGLDVGRPGRDAERESAIRALYLTVTLVVTLIVWVTSALALLSALAMLMLKAPEGMFYADPVSATAWAAVGLAVWLFHSTVRRRDLTADPVDGAAAWIPRLYLYGVSLGALIASLTSLDSLLTSVLWASSNLADAEQAGYARLAVVRGGIAAIAWGLVWFGHWRYATNLVGGDDWRGMDERVSRTRVTAFIATIIIAAAGTIAGTARLVEAVIRPLLGMDPAGNETWASLVAAPLGMAVPWAVVWWAHLRGLRREPSAQDPLRALHQARLETHGVAAAALVSGAVGLGWLLGIAFDVALGGSRTANRYGQSWTAELALWAPLAVVGLTVWAWRWSRVLERRRTDPGSEANSTIRRAFLYLTLAGGLIAALAGGALVVYRLVGTVLGANLTGNAVSELSTPVGALVAAVAVLIYHGAQLRSDQGLRVAVPVSAPDAQAAGSTRQPQAEAALPTVGETSEVRRALQLVAADGTDLDAALAAARAALPEGVRLEETST